MVAVTAFKIAGLDSPWPNFGSTTNQQRLDWTPQNEPYTPGDYTNVWHAAVIFCKTAQTITPPTGWTQEAVHDDGKWKTYLFSGDAATVGHGLQRFVRTSASLYALGHFRTLANVYDCYGSTIDVTSVGTSTLDIPAPPDSPTNYGIWVGEGNIGYTPGTTDSSGSMIATGHVWGDGVTGYQDGNAQFSESGVSTIGPSEGYGLGEPDPIATLQFNSSTLGVVTLSRGWFAGLYFSTDAVPSAGGWLVGSVPI